MSNFQIKCGEIISKQKYQELENHYFENLTEYNIQYLLKENYIHCDYEDDISVYSNISHVTVYLIATKYSGYITNKCSFASIFVAIIALYYFGFLNEQQTENYYKELYGMYKRGTAIDIRNFWLFEEN